VQLRILGYLAVVITLYPSIGWSHGGGLDSQGGHNNRQEGTYHFHDGPLEGQVFASKEEAAVALLGVGDGEQPPTPSEIPLVDLTPYLPAHTPDDQIITHRAYTLQYCEAHEQAAWVAYLITDEQLRTSVERTDDFRTDPLVTTGSAILDDYSGSGFDRGHLAPAAAMAWSPEVMSESFYLSNMSPQDPSFNRGIWRVLEDEVRGFAQLHGEVFVVTGPVLRDRLPTIGPSGVSIPEHYFKVVLDYREPGLEGIAFVLANAAADGPIEAFAVSIDSLESLTGIDFFPVLPDPTEDRIEGSIKFEHWSFNGEAIPTAVAKSTWEAIKRKN
jgi:endonuclease G, mitochondrial